MNLSDKELENFYEMVSDILANKHFQELKSCPHHGINRYDHLIHVSMLTYKKCKEDKTINLRNTVRASLLHDFFTDEDVNGVRGDKLYKVHPVVALENASKYFELTDIQKDIILNHMYPVTSTMPKTKEGKIVSLCDKECSIKEFAYNRVIRKKDDAYHLDDLLESYKDNNTRSKTRIKTANI